MEPATVRRAIQAALSADWETAIETNQLLLKENPSDLDALMRLSHAYIATGNYKLAKKNAKLVASLDPANTLARKCLSRCESLEKSSGSVTFGKVSLDNFLEEPGKTKTVALKHLGTSKTVISLIPGEAVVIMTTKRQASVQTEKGIHVGHLPDDVAAWVIIHKKQGFEIQGFVKSASANGVVILIKLKGSPTLPQ